MTIAKRDRNATGPGSEVARGLMAAVVLRYRAAGHLRFDLPEPLTRPGAVAVLKQGLARLEGLYRVDIYRHPAKLSLRFDTAACDERQVVRALAALVADIAVHPDAAPQPAGAGRFLDRLKEIGPVKALRARYERARRTGSVAARVIAVKMGLKEPLPFDARDWAMNFFNDLVAFYLIKVHWERITRQWLMDPIKYRTQWAAVIYLVFLLVQSRKARK
jgi:hypothetical protein